MGIEKHSGHVTSDDGYIASRQAAEITGYAQDYIGQLARRGHIRARRVGGLWHVSRDSLMSYIKQVEEVGVVPAEAQQKVQDDDTSESTVTFDGREYISAKRASQLSGYNQDYIGQLARSGKIVSRQIANRWYVNEADLLAHKEEKDALLYAVQSQSVGLRKAEDQYGSASVPDLLTYQADAHTDLLPMIAVSATGEHAGDVPTIIPITVARTEAPRTRHGRREMRRSRPYNHAHPEHKTVSRVHGKSIHRAVLVPASLLTVVMLISIGLLSMRGGQSYAGGNVLRSPLASSSVQLQSLTSTTATAFNAFIDTLENVLAPEVAYRRR